MDNSTRIEPSGSKRVRLDGLMALAIIAIGPVVEGIRQIVAITS